jgi:uncharacterized protein YndB with AHSA1/START domain
MATSRATPDELITEVQIAAPRERVFEAIIDPQQRIKWWGRPGLYRATKFTGDLRVGGKWRTEGDSGGGRTFFVYGEYLQVDPPRLLEHTWVASWSGEAQTTVRWELEEKDGGTLLRIRHYGLSAHPELGEHYKGWPQVVAWLQAYVERGESLPETEKTA